MDQAFGNGACELARIGADEVQACLPQQGDRAGQRVGFEDHVGVEEDEHGRTRVRCCGEAGAGPRLADEPGRRIAMAADWGTDTEQALFIGERMSEHRPHVTIHLGDTYYSGTKTELEWNYGKGKGDHGIWPRGSLGSFALAGNHEMYSSGTAFFEMIRDANRGFGMRDRVTGHFRGQPAPCFCLRTPYWLVLGLDTGYDSLKTGILRFHPDNTALRIPDAVISWLKQEVLTPGEKRGIILLTHHQYVTVFHEESEFTEPARQLHKLLPDSTGVLWIWGHEHRFALYGKNRLGLDHLPAYGRCIGNGGMPDEHTRGRYLMRGKAKARGLVVYDKRTADCFPRRGLFGPRSLGVGFNGYALLQLSGPEAVLTYYAGYKKENGKDPGINEAVLRERWQADTGMGIIRCLDVTDFTTRHPDGSRLSYHGKQDPNRIGQ